MKGILVLLGLAALIWLLGEVDGGRTLAADQTDAAAARVPASGSDPFTVRVLEVLDGDSLRVSDGARTLEVRLHGIDAPEFGQPGSDAARRALRSMTRGAELTLTPVTIDRFGRTVGELHRDGEHLNRRLVAEGHAWVFRRFSRDPALLQAQAQAQAARRGLWRRGEPVAPWEWRDRSAHRPLPATPGQREASSAACRIKGNVSSRGDRIYHVPGQKYYEATRISPGKGERWFCDEAEAKAAGWRRARQ